nr:hypothetical protein [uncultured Desulfuromonas sp.]
MKNTEEHFFAIVAPGFETLCARELQAALNVPTTVEYGGVSFKGKLRELYLANLWSRCASRIVVRLSPFACRDFPTLYRKALRLPWGGFIKQSTALDVRVTCHRSRLNHSGRVAQTLHDAIDKALGGLNPSQGETSSQQVLVRLDNDTCQISIDSSGERLHRRGYREKMTPAPMRESLAAGCLLHTGWDGRHDFLDALCGSGTLAIEAALIAARIAPGSRRCFAFQSWPGYRHNLWQSLLDDARRLQIVPTVSITASDCDDKAVAAARQNAAAAGVEQWIHFKTCPYQEQSPSSDQGLWLSNPPYGERLKQAESLLYQYLELRNYFGSHFSGWQGAVILPEPLHGSPPPGLRFRNGGLAVGLFPLNDDRNK